MPRICLLFDHLKGQWPKALLYWRRLLLIEFRFGWGDEAVTAHIKAGDISVIWQA